MEDQETLVRLGEEADVLLGGALHGQTSSEGS